MKTNLIAGLFSFFLTVICGIIVIPILRKIKVGQPILKYVETHKEKNGTPTMGGLFFVIPAVTIFLFFGGIKGKIALVSAAIGVAFMLVGFLDDFLKVKLGHNEGLKAYQKIIFQIAISLAAGVFAYLNDLTIFFLPFTDKIVNFGIFTIPIVCVILIAVTNSVNLTDGLDGLAGGVSVVYLSFMAILIFLQVNINKSLYFSKGEYEKLTLLIITLIFSLFGFLVFNTSKAKVFMGDTGSLALGGFIGTSSIFSSNSFFIPLLGIMFVVSSISVIIQVLHYKRTRNRIFLMAPYHHHLQLKGYSEAQISFCYSTVTFICGIVSILSLI